MKVARLILVYRGVKVTPRRVKFVLDELENRRGTSNEDLSIPIIRHVFAREHGWSHAETDNLTIRQAQQEMSLIEEDMVARRETKQIDL